LSQHGLDLSQLDQSGATTGQVPTWNGSKYVPATPSGGTPGGVLITRGSGKYVLPEWMWQTAYDNSGSNVLSATIYAAPLMRPGSFSGVFTAFGGSDTGQVRLGVATADATTGLPSTLIEEPTASSPLTPNSALVTAAFASQRSLSAPTWVLFLCDLTAHVPVQLMRGGGVTDRIGADSTDITSPVFSAFGLVASYAFGALPSNLSTLTWARDTNGNPNYWPLFGLKT
jgi:hypothetical protein